jgi:hypothetical protein
MLEEGLDLAYALFHVQMSEGCATEAGWAIKDEAFGVAVETTFREDSTHAFRLDLVELLTCEVTIRERVADAGKVDGEVIHPGFTSVDGAALNK